MTGPSAEPRNLVEYAIAEAMETVERVLAEEGATLEVASLSVKAEGVPEGQPNAGTAVSGESLSDDLEERAKEGLVFLLASVRQAAHAIGLDVQIVPMTKFGKG